MVKEALLDVLKREVVVTDGATGTRFYDKGVPLTQCYEELNISNPRLVAELHREYIAAGARLIQTNTFGANRSKLQHFNLEGKVHEINLQGAKLAAKVAGSSVYVSGSMGPIRHPDDPTQKYSDTEMVDMFHEQARALYFGGVDLITLETFSNLHELRLAWQAVRDVSKDLLIIPQVAFVEVARIASGAGLAEVVQCCEDLGARAIGANCGLGPHHMIQIVKRLAQYSTLPILAVPNAGYPEYHEGRIRYLTTPEYMGQCAEALVAAGANALGGCCGTDPEHIRAMAAAVAGKTPAPRGDLIPAQVRKKVTEVIRRPKKQFDVLDGLGKRLMWTVEVDPPVGLDISKFLKGCEVFKECGIDGVNIAENPLGRSRMSTTVLGNIVQEQYELPAIVHITGRDRNIIGLQSELLGAGLLNISSILAITGDPTTAGDYPWAKSVFDANSFGLVELISKLNSGVNLAGHSIDRPTSFSIGVAFNASKGRMDNEVKRLEKKVACGAHYAQTQPIYDKERVLEVVERTAHTRLPVFIGILPVISYRNAEFLHNEFPGISIPEHFRESLRKCAGDKEEETKVSVDLITELMLSVRDKVQGFYMIPQFNRFQMVRTIIENVRNS